MNGAQGTICLPSCKDTLLAHINFFVYQDPRALLHKAGLKYVNMKKKNQKTNTNQSFASHHLSVHMTYFWELIHSMQVLTGVLSDHCHVPPENGFLLLNPIQNCLSSVL